MLRVRSPDPATALKIYYSYCEIGNAEIRQLFGSQLSPTTLVRLKDIAREQMDKDGKYAYRPTYVNTKSAYRAWGINIEEIESGYKKLQRLNLMGG